ncbi:hypothetical protein [Cellulomonas shaoxiangyii]|uniref:Uncharacterized protein n=1 Tax=Cellulomonas shaoxiangyii TaxID=2566013 RepID=A0A4P7SKN8_9CELL|nr:hypothetical protein [Cellulomonas shaoxiangyii]QCB94760.1 hypothetical protein E5225_15540 [Cellulomonas shaoxiangyii]TGY86490.1 hypothetical protein E5226_01565 [Cellulomonas shaoxiangyii]
MLLRVERGPPDLHDGLRLLADLERVPAGCRDLSARRFTRGEFSARELCRWAHGAVGHDGDPSCQAFVDLHDIYETVEYYPDEDDASLERRTAEATRAFLDARY